MIIFLVLWVLFIFVATCTSDVHGFLQHGKIKFTLIQNPNWSDFFHVIPPNDASKIELAGHFMMFFVLAYLLSLVIQRLSIVVLVAVMYAVITEILQLYFGRGGVIFDVVADAVGVFTYVLLHILFSGVKAG